MKLVMAMRFNHLLANYKSRQKLVLQNLQGKDFVCFKHAAHLVFNFGLIKSRSYGAGDSSIYEAQAS